MAKKISPDKAIMKKKPSTAKIAFIVISLIVICLFAIGKASDNDESLFSGTSRIDYFSDYVAVLDFSGDIESSSVTGSTYDHAWTMNAIDQLIDDNDNKALVIRVNSPGGDVYTTDEAYRKIRKYQKTGRPVYAVMESEAASGGYYISAPCNKIYADKNCWTGSIGVTTGTMYNVSGLLSKLGITTETITSGKNKSMGSSTEKLTEEQRSIYQSLIDESYDNFVSVVADGRNMSTAKVKALADGRVYSASQAKALGLVDTVCPEEDAFKDILSQKSLRGCKTHYIQPSETEQIMSSVSSSVNKLLESKTSDYTQLLEIINGGNKFSVTYKAQISK